MKAFLNKTIRENKTAAIVNMGKGVYGLKVPLSIYPPPRQLSPYPRPRISSPAHLQLSVNSAWCRVVERLSASYRGLKFEFKFVG